MRKKRPVEPVRTDYSSQEAALPPIHTSAPADTESAEAQTSDAAAYIAAGLLSTANTPPEAD